MKIATFSVAAMATAMSLFPLVASAYSPPAECKATASGRRGYDQGYTQERNILDDIWARWYDCDTVEDFVAAVDLPVLGSSPSLYLECRNHGMVDAVWDVVEEQVSQCVVDCFSNGEDWGRHHAEVYCALPSSELSTRMADVELCPFFNELGCRTTLINQISRDCNDRAAADPDFDTWVDLVCSPI